MARSLFALTVSFCFSRSLKNFWEYLSVGITVLTVLVLYDQKWSKSRGLENHLFIYTEKPYVLFTHTVCQLHSMMCYVLCLQNVHHGTLLNYTHTQFLADISEKFSCLTIVASLSYTHGSVCSQKLVLQHLNWFYLNYNLFMSLVLYWRFSYKIHAYDRNRTQFYFMCTSFPSCLQANARIVP
jgi:hypothetical protein